MLKLGKKSHIVYMIMKIINIFTANKSQSMAIHILLAKLMRFFIEKEIIVEIGKCKITIFSDNSNETLLLPLEREREQFLIMNLRFYKRL